MAVLSTRVVVNAPRCHPRASLDCATATVPRIPCYASTGVVVRSSTVQAARSEVPVISKLLAFAFVLLFVGKMFFKPQLRAFGKWLDGAVNAMLVAIALVWGIQLVIYLAR